jgi:hypothetical protein
MHVDVPRRLRAGRLERVRHVRRHLHPRAGSSPKLLAAGRERELSRDHVEALDVPLVHVQRRRGRAAAARARHVHDRDLVHVDEQGDTKPGRVREHLAGPHVRVLGRAAAVGGRILGVEAGRLPAHVRGEAAARSVEVEVAQLLVGPVPEAVDDERRRQHDRPGPVRRLQPVRPDQHRQLAREDVEEVRVLPVHVRGGAVPVRLEARPGRAQLLAVGQDLDAALGHVPHDVPAAGW